MENQTAISVDHVTKMYKLYEKPSDRLKESLGLSKKKYYREHYALMDISFSVFRGETVGIIGTNGAGKSTILKIITGVLNPTAGNVTVNGRISALLELGAGFNMEYTGVENVYLNGTMMGFSEEEVDAKLQDILDFADIGDFVYQPVKTYSSGMFVRLAFAVAINIDPEILIVDEALSVGDVFFQAKCYRKFEEFKREGKTILFVSHDLNSISKYCDRVVLLDRGRVVEIGTPKDMVNLYKQLLVHQAPGQTGARVNRGPNGTAGRKSSAGDSASGQDGAAGSSASGQDGTVGGGSSASGQDGTPGGGSGACEQNGTAGAGAGLSSGKGSAGTAAREEPHWIEPYEANPNTLEYGDLRAEMVGFMLLDKDGLPTNTIEKGAPFTMKVKVRYNEDVEDPIFAFTIKDMRGTEITGTNTMFERITVPPRRKGDIDVVSYTQRADLQGGEYLISFGLTGYRGGDFVVYHRLYDACSLVVVSAKNTVGFYDMNSEIVISHEEAGSGVRQ